MQIERLDHAAIRTPQLELSRRFYVDVLGLAEGPRPDFPFNGHWLYAGQRDVVHLIEADAPESPPAAAAINHFALRVADFDNAVADLEAMGVDFETETTPGGELRQIYLTDPNGVRVELNAPGAPP